MVTLADAPRPSAAGLRRLEDGRVELYDTTTRDGLHGLGVYFSKPVKVRIARALLDVGFDLVEVGFPQACPGDVELFRVDLADVRDRVVPIGYKSKAGLEAADDPGLSALLGCETRVVALIGKTSAEAVRTVLRLDPARHLDHVQASAELLAREGRDVVFMLEGFLDAHRHDSGYALQVVDRAVAGGARRVVLCDTSGGSLPDEVAAAVRAVRGRVAARPPRGADPADVVVGFHGHNDCGVGVANALAAVGAGAGHVQGTVNGVGGRCGNTDLVVTALNLELKCGRRVLPDGGRKRLVEVSRLVCDVLNRPYQSDQPYVGSNAFAHKAGVQADAALIDGVAPHQHVDPTEVGNRPRLVLSGLAGPRAVQLRFKERFGLALSDDVAEALLAEVTRMEAEGGYQLDEAQATVYLLAVRLLGPYEPWFKVRSYSVLVKHTERTVSEEEVEAAVRVAVDGELVHTVDVGTGPLNALDRALRKALEPTHPRLKHVKLIDYMVRVIDTPEGTAGRVRVTLKTKRWDHELKDYQEWGTSGVSTNLIEATWMALLDSLYFWQLLEANCVLRKHFHNGVVPTGAGHV